MDKNEALALISDAFNSLNDINNGYESNPNKKQVKLVTRKCESKQLKSCFKTPIKPIRIDRIDFSR